MVTYQRSFEKEEINECQVIILEGIFSFYFDEICASKESGNFLRKALRWACTKSILMADDGVCSGEDGDEDGERGKETRRRKGDISCGVRGLMI